MALLDWFLKDGPKSAAGRGTGCDHQDSHRLTYLAIHPAVSAFSIGFSLGHPYISLVTSRSGCFMKRHDSSFYPSEFCLSGLYLM